MPADIEAELAEGSMYAWWWRFLRICPDYPVTERHLADSVRLGVQADFGELGNDFRTWWRAGGRELFRERGGLPLVRALMPGGHVDIAEHEIAVVLPLIVNRDLILQQVDRLLAQFHDGHGLERHRYSTARRRLYPKHRYRTERYLNMIDIIEMQRANPLMPAYEIGEALGVGATKYMPEETDRREVVLEKRAGMSKAVEGLLERSLTIAHNAALGVFPFEDRRLTSEEAMKLTK
jgi:hypothetical protein